MGGGCFFFFRLLFETYCFNIPLLGIFHRRVKLIPILRCPGGPSSNCNYWVLHPGAGPLGEAADGKAEHNEACLMWPIHLACDGAVLALWCVGAGREEPIHVTVSTNWRVWLSALRSTQKSRRKWRSLGT